MNEMGNFYDKYNPSIIDKKSIQKSPHLRSESTHKFIDHCSDYLVKNEDVSYIGHNEDGGTITRNKGFLLYAHVVGEGVREEIEFVSFVYPGQLATVALFHNSFGISATMNGLNPATCLEGGIGRMFIGRDLVGATSIQDALDRITVPNQATAHNYNIHSVAEKRLLNIEVANGNQEDRNVEYHVQEIEVGSPLFHANEFIFITDIEQVVFF